MQYAYNNMCMVCTLSPSLAHFLWRYRGQLVMATMASHPLECTLRNTLQEKGERHRLHCRTLNLNKHYVHFCAGNGTWQDPVGCSHHSWSLLEALKKRSASRSRLL